MTSFITPPPSPTPSEEFRQYVMALPAGAVHMPYPPQDEMIENNWIPQDNLDILEMVMEDINRAKEGQDNVSPKMDENPLDLTNRDDDLADESETASASASASKAEDEAEDETEPSALAKLKSYRRPNKETEMNVTHFNFNSISAYGPSQLWSGLYY